MLIYTYQNHSKIKKCENNNFERNELNTKIFLNRKRKQDKNSDNNNIKEEDNLKEKENINIKGNIKRGRREKDEEYNNEPEYCIIQKIKTSVFNYILEQLNKRLKFEMINFYPLSKELNTNLKKDFNEQLLEITIYDIYINTDLNKGYINISDSNKTLIKKIYEEKIEKDAINILKMKFKDILNYIREKDLDNFLANIRKKEIKKGNKLVDSYMNDVKKMLFKYEFWLKVKLVRNSRKNKKVQKANSSFCFPQKFEQDKYIL